MATVTIELWEGRSVDQKRNAAEKITDAVVETLGVKKEIVKIRFIDIKKHDVARGGQLIIDKQ